MIRARPLKRLENKTRHPSWAAANKKQQGEESHD